MRRLPGLRQRRTRAGLEAERGEGGPGVPYHVSGPQRGLPGHQGRGPRGHGGRGSLRTAVLSRDGHPREPGGRLPGDLQPLLRPGLGLYLQHFPGLPAAEKVRRERPGGGAEVRPDHRSRRLGEDGDSGFHRHQRLQRRHGGR